MCDILFTYILFALHPCWFCQRMSAGNEKQSSNVKQFDQMDSSIQNLIHYLNLCMWIQIFLAMQVRTHF